MMARLMMRGNRLGGNELLQCVGSDQKGANLRGGGCVLVGSGLEVFLSFF